MTTLSLATLAVLLAGPAPALMARRPVLRRTPWSAMVLWQSVALAAVLSALGAGLSLTTSSGLGDGHGPAGYVVAVLALLLTGLVLARLLLSGHRVGTDLRDLRRRHRELIDLLAPPDETDLRVLDDDTPVAYCLPGIRTARVVVSAGVLGRLGARETEAVLAHERAHLRARHDLVLEAFGVLHHAYPRWVSSRLALAEVRLLVEVLADAVAARSVGRRALGRALVELAETRTPGGERGVALGSGGDDVLVRVHLLGESDPHRVQATALLLLALAVLVLPTAFVVTPWLSGLTT